MRKILIFYSSIGNGHISAAETIRKKLLLRSPSDVVVLKDIRDFMNPAWEPVDEKLYWFVANNLPQSFDALFSSFTDSGSRALSLSRISGSYSVEAVGAFVEREAPDAIVSTHYGAAQLLGGLRERGQLTITPIGWVHTDYFESYFPRISQRIDRTFLAHPELAERWIEAGVAAEKVAVTGMPVDVPGLDRSELRRDLAALNLSSGVFTVMVMTGRNGVGDHQAMVESLTAELGAPLQIVVACGTNEAQRRRLAKLSARLPASVTLLPLGLVPHDRAVRLIGAADLLVTKPGGLTPSEAFCLGTPTVVLDVIGGHERHNADRFVRWNLAASAPDAASLGRTAAALVANGDRLAAMRAAQAGYGRRVDLDPIVDFALGGRALVAEPPYTFGRENGVAAAGIDAALRRMDSHAPADVELLLSYSTARTPQRIVLENPFGHIAIRIGGTVYSANHKAIRSTDPTLMQHIPLADYLYGIVPPSPSQLHTNTYGMAYGRETVALRIAGVAPDRMLAMQGEIAMIEREFASGRLAWDKRTSNCADLVTRILAAGGWGMDIASRPLGLPSMPLDVFEAADAALTRDPALSTAIVAYRQVSGTRADYRHCRFPLSLYQPVRSLSHVIRNDGEDTLEGRIGCQVTSLHGGEALFVETLAPPEAERAVAERAVRSIERAMVADIRAQVARSFPAASPGASGAEAIKEAARLLERMQAILDRSLATVRSLGPDHAERLRRLHDEALAFELRAGVAARLARRKMRGRVDLAAMRAALPTDILLTAAKSQRQRVAEAWSALRGRSAR